MHVETATNNKLYWVGFLKYFLLMEYTIKKVWGPLPYGVRELTNSRRTAHVGVSTPFENS